MLHIMCEGGGVVKYLVGLYLHHTPNITIRRIQKIKHQNTKDKTLHIKTQWGKKVISQSDNDGGSMGILHVLYSMTKSIHDEAIVNTIVSHKMKWLICHL